MVKVTSCFTFHLLLKSLFASMSSAVRQLLTALFRLYCNLTLILLAFSPNVFGLDWYYKAQEKQSVYGSFICIDHGLSTDFFLPNFRFMAIKIIVRQHVTWDLPLNWEDRLNTRERKLCTSYSKKREIYISK